MHKCVGDELCIAKQDLILAVDGSGSLTEDGFGILRDFAFQLIGKYQTEYYGSPAASGSLAVRKLCYPC